MKLFKKIFFIIFLLILNSCENPFNPEKIDNNIDSGSYSFATPEETLQNLSLSYQNRDIELFRLCLSNEFRFELISTEVNEIGIDMDNDNIPDSWWGYQQELDYHRNLFIGGASENDFPAPDELNLNMVIPPPSSWSEDIENEGWIIISCSFTLELIFYESNTRIDANGFARFHLKQEAGNWVIAIWRDESNL